MASSPIRPLKADRPANRSGQSVPYQPRHYSVQSSPGPSSRGSPSFGRPKLFSLQYRSSPLQGSGFWYSGRDPDVDPHKLAAVEKKHQHVVDVWAEKWRDADSDDEEVDLDTMTTYRSDGTVGRYDPDSLDEEEEEIEGEGDQSTSDTEEEDSDADPIGDWKEQEKIVEQQDEERELARIARKRSEDPFFAAKATDDAQLLELFRQDEERRKAKSRERSLSARPVSHEAMGAVKRGAAILEVDADEQNQSDSHEDSITDEDEGEVPISSHEVEAVIARAKDLRLAASAFAVSLSPEPESSGLGTSNARASVVPTRPSGYSYWKMPASNQVQTSGRKGKGKDRMVGERPSDPLPVTSQPVESAKVDATQTMTHAKSCRRRLHAPTTPGKSGSDGLDPYYYRTATYKSGGSDKIRTCRLCLRAGGVRATLAANCRGCISFRACRFPRELEEPVQEVGADSAADADLDDTPTTSSRPKLKTKRRPRLESRARSTDTHRPLSLPERHTKSRLRAATTPDTTLDVDSLDRNYYLHGLIVRSNGSGYRHCAICMRADPERSRRSFWCKGRTSSHHCGFLDSDEKTTLLSQRHRKDQQAMIAPDVDSSSRLPDVSPTGSTIRGRTTNTSIPSSDGLLHNDPTSAAPRSEKYHARLHRLHNGGYMHCTHCRTAGGERARMSGYCRGRMGKRLCSFERYHDPAYTARRISITFGTDGAADAKSSAPIGPKTSTAGKHVEHNSDAKRKRRRPQDGVIATSSSTVIDDDVPLASLAAGPTLTRSDPMQDDSPVPRPEVIRKIARPRPKTPLSQATPLLRAMSAPRARAPSDPNDTKSEPASRAPNFEIVIPVRSHNRKTPDTHPLPIPRVLDTPVSPDIRPKHLDFRPPRSGTIESEASRVGFPFSSPLPPSSPPMGSPVHAGQTTLLVRPTPPDSTRERSTVTPSGRHHDPSRQPIKSSLRQSSEISDAPRSIKRARFSMPLSPSSNRGQGQESFRILQPKSESHKEKESIAAEDSDSSDDGGFLLTAARSKSRSSSARPSTQHHHHDLWSSSPSVKRKRPEWSADSGRLPPSLVARFSTAFEDFRPQAESSVSSVPKRSLMLPPPVPSRAIGGSLEPKMPRSEPRPTQSQMIRAKSGIKTARPRSKSLALHHRDARDVPVF